MEQKQKDILVKMIDGSSVHGVVNGNNAAWLCACGYEKPLLWGGNMPNHPVGCKQCNKIFIGLSEKLQGKPHKICEKPAGEIKGDTQQQDFIPLEFRDAPEGCAIRVGDGGGANAAWMCICGYHLPLIWSAFLASRCPHTVCCCGKKFKGEGDGPKKIIEV